MDSFSQLTTAYDMLCYVKLTALSRVGLGMYPGIYPFNPPGWVFSVKKPGFFC